MSKRLNHEGIMEAAMADDVDRISALPDELLQYVMSFLLSREAVRTCVLAKRWRMLWKSVPALRVCDPESYYGVNGSGTFVDELLRLGDPTPLDVCDISADQDCDESEGDDEAFRHMVPWLEYALTSEVRVLRIHFPCLVTNMTLISSHLKKFQLCLLHLEGTLDFSSCQVLEVLEMTDCEISADILSHSLRHLEISDGGFDMDTRTRISAPNLVGLKLAPSWGFTPSLDSMTSLATASIALGKGCVEDCYYRQILHDDCDHSAGNSVILDSLSGATNLELTLFDPDMLIFSNDLKCCPMFSKLKTLLLNEWCVIDNFTGLIYFLQHSPILETLTLRLDFHSHEKGSAIETAKSYDSREQPLLLKHLKLVKIICDTKDDTRVHLILRILLTHGVLSEQIDIL